MRRGGRAAAGARRARRAPRWPRRRAARREDLFEKRGNAARFRGFADEACNLASHRGPRLDLVTRLAHVERLVLRRVEGGDGHDLRLRERSRYRQASSGPSARERTGTQSRRTRPSRGRCRRPRALRRTARPASARRCIDAGSVSARSTSASAGTDLKDHAKIFASVQGPSRCDGFARDRGLKCPSHAKCRTVEGLIVTRGAFRPRARTCGVRKVGSRGDVVFVEESAESVSALDGGGRRVQDPQLASRGIGWLEVE